MAAAQQPKCTLLPNQHWPGKAFKNVKQKKVQSLPSRQHLTELATLQLVKGHPPSSNPEEAMTRDALIGNMKA